MKLLNQTLFAGLLLSLAAPAAAQERFVPYDVVNGELSEGTQAPSVAQMEQAILTASPTRLRATLEYGERVECHRCVPLLQAALFDSSDAGVREIAAWWLRRRPFGLGAIIHSVRNVLATDADAVRRARAAEALGIFRVPQTVDALMTALDDPDAGVRTAVVNALGYMNTPAANPGIIRAFSDVDHNVREAAVAQVLLVNGFNGHEELMGLLADEDMYVRSRAASALGAFRTEAAVPALVSLLSDGNMRVRQQAAFALGRIGTAEARAALNEGRALEQDRLVLDAYDSALAVRR
ncbi:MAG: HEAT repeat domain-containing protein [Sandaracinaceae bacterium]